LKLEVIIRKLTLIRFSTLLRLEAKNQMMVDRGGETN